MPFIASIAIVVILILASAIRILKEYERGVIFRLGRLIGAKGPGLIILIPFVHIVPIQTIIPYDH